jgi:hypothetical protein
MGFNAVSAGFRDAEDMVTQMMRGENEQILGMASFMRANGMHSALQARDWTGFARRYNGPGFANNRYHEKLAAAHGSISSKGLPDLHLRGVQLLLTYHGFSPGKIDGPAEDDQVVLPSSAPATPRAAPDLQLVQSLPSCSRSWLWWAAIPSILFMKFSSVRSIRSATSSVSRRTGGSTISNALRRQRLWRSRDRPQRLAQLQEALSANPDMDQIRKRLDGLIQPIGVRAG